LDSWKRGRWTTKYFLDTTATLDKALDQTCLCSLGQ
jgi:hypothetical protein